MGRVGLLDLWDAEIAEVRRAASLPETNPPELHLDGDSTLANKFTRRGTADGRDRNAPREEGGMAGVRTE